MSERTTPDITIDCDRPCNGCGEKGACENGLCLRCNTEMMRGVKPIDAKVLQKAFDDAAGLLTEHWPDVIRARNAAAVEAGRQGKDKFSYAVNLTIKMEPRGNECRVSVSIGYSVKHADETEQALVSSNPELPGMASETK